MLCHPEPHPAVNYALRNAKSPFKARVHDGSLSRLLNRLSQVDVAVT